MIYISVYQICQSITTYILTKIKDVYEVCMSFSLGYPVTTWQKQRNPHTILLYESGRQHTPLLRFHPTWNAES